MRHLCEDGTGTKVIVSVDEGCEPGIGASMARIKLEGRGVMSKVE